MKLEYMHRFLLLVVLVPSFATTSANAQSQQTDTTAKSSLIVGTKSAPPFAMMDDQGQWFGISIDLMRVIAKKLAWIIHGVAGISRRDLVSQGILFLRQILIDICKRKNSLWNQRSSEMPSIP